MFDKLESQKCHLQNFSCHNVPSHPQRIMSLLKPNYIYLFPRFPKVLFYDSIISELQIGILSAQNSNHLITISSSTSSESDMDERLATFLSGLEREFVSQFIQIVDGIQFFLVVGVSPASLLALHQDPHSAPRGQCHSIYRVPSAV